MITSPISSVFPQFKSTSFHNCNVVRQGPGAPFSKAPVYAPETSCMKGTFVHIKNMWIKQLCNRKVRDFAMALRTRKVSGTFEKRAPGNTIPTLVIIFLYSKDNHCKTVQRVAVSIIHEPHWLRKGLLPQLLSFSQSNWNLAFFAIPSRVSFSTKAHKAVCLINWFADSTVLARFTRAWRLREEKKKTLVDQIGAETEKNPDNR